MGFKDKESLCFQKGALKKQINRSKMSKLYRCFCGNTNSVCVLYENDPKIYLF